MIRRNKGEPLKPASWDEAMDFFVEKFRDAWRQGHQNLACYNSGQLTIEEFYTLAKFWRGGLQSANLDGNTRLCTATSATGLMANFGTDGPVASYVDVDQADLLCLYGHNVAEVQTVLWDALRQLLDGFAIEHGLASAGVGRERVARAIQRRRDLDGFQRLWLFVGRNG